MRRLWAAAFFAAVLAAEPVPPITKGQVTAVVFLSARCPVSNAYGDRFEKLYRDYAPRGVRFLFVNPNANESVSEISENVRRHEFTFPVYHDQKGETAIKLGAQFTPEAYVLDRESVVRYHGGVDDAQNPARVKVESLRLALEAVLAGRSVPIPVKKAFGCSIKLPRDVR